MQKSMNKLYYSPESLRDLTEIMEYISVELDNHIAAENTVSKILDTVEKLQDFAEIGVSLTSISGLLSDYRYLVCGSYIAFYRIDGGNIYIDRILYGRRDYMRILFPLEAD